MKYQEKNYKPRLIDKKIKDYLSVFGAISIEGAKWCGKTWSSLKHSKSVTLMDDENNKKMATIEAKSIFKDINERPQLIDEWHLVPELWDAVRRECDMSDIKGNFILTGSTTLPRKITNDKVHHSGVGRIARIKMYTMSLYESGDSNGKASLTNMLNGTQKSISTNDTSLRFLAELIVRGGWPENINIPTDKIHLIPKSYIESIINIDMNKNDERKRDKTKMRMLLKSLARNESSIIGNKTIIKDIEEHETQDELLTSRNTMNEYLNILDRLYLLENQEAYSENYRSPKRLGKSPKRHFTDPSLACSCLDLNIDKLMQNLNTFGFLFESLVERDLRIYMDYLDGHLYHFRDNVTGLEVDSILEFPGGEYAAVEIKLGINMVDEAIDNLMRFKDNMIKKPKFMCVIVGVASSIARDDKTGIYIVPITALKP